MPDTPRPVCRGPTRRCSPACKHCRAGAADADCSAGTTLASAKKAIDDSIAFANPVMALDGAEPLCRDDSVDSAGHAASRRLRVALAANAALINEQCAHRELCTGAMRARAQRTCGDPRSPEPSWYQGDTEIGLDAAKRDELRERGGDFSRPEELCT